MREYQDWVILEQKDVPVRRKEDVQWERQQLFGHFIREGLSDLFAGLHPQAPALVRRRFGEGGDLMYMRLGLQPAPTFASLREELGFSNTHKMTEIENVCYRRLQRVYAGNRLFIQPEPNAASQYSGEDFPSYSVLPRSIAFTYNDSDLDLLMLSRGVQFALQSGGYRSLNGLARALDEDLKKLSHRNTRIKDHLPLVRRQLDIVKQWLMREKTRVAGANSA